MTNSNSAGTLCASDELRDDGLDEAQPLDPPTPEELSLVIRKDIMVAVYENRFAAGLALFHTGDWILWNGRLSERLGHIFTTLRNGSTKYTGRMERNE